MRADRFLGFSCWCGSVFFVVMLCACGATTEVSHDGSDTGATSCVPDQPLEDLDSKQKVTFEFSGSEVSGVVVSGSRCDVFDIRDENDSPLLQTRPYAPLCEGAPPPRPCVERTTVASDHPTIVWRGTSLHKYFTCEDCAIWDRPEAFRAPQYAVQPVATGQYRATFAIVDPADETPYYGCHQIDYDWDIPVPVEICPSSRTVSVDFTLPETGDITVSVNVD